MNDKEGRYYYDCPIKAAYMMKHFDMRFEDAREGTQQGHVGFSAGHYLFAECDELYDLAEEREIRLYIHPDSLGLLEPVDGDVYLDTQSRPEVWHKHFYIANEKHTMPWNRKYRIIQRNGQAFIWPEDKEGRL